MRSETWQAWPEEPLFSWQVTRILGLIDFGGANWAEVWEAVQHIRSGDSESWHSQWASLGDRVAAMADEARAAGVQSTACMDYWRAAQYYRLAQFFLFGSDSRKVPFLRKMKGAFRKGIELQNRRIEDVGIPYEGRVLPGYFLPASTTPAPTLIYLNGANSLSEEAFFTTGLAAQDFGYNILIWDAPGVGTTLYDLGVPTRSDAEVFVTAAIDFLEQRSDVKRDAIGLLGESFAGYLVPRAAVFEQRVRAAVVWSPIYELDLRHVLEASPPPFRDHLMRLIGATPDTFELEARKYALTGILGQLNRPMLLIQGSDDWLIPRPIEAALRIAREAPRGLVDVRVVEPDEGVGGATHCQKDNLHVAHLETFRWFASHLA